MRYLKLSLLLWTPFAFGCSTSSVAPCEDRLLAEVDASATGDWRAVLDSATQLLSPDSQVQIVVRFTDGPTSVDISELERVGVEPTYQFAAIPAVIGMATPSEARSAAALERVTLVRITQSANALLDTGCDSPQQ